MQSHNALLQSSADRKRSLWHLGLLSDEEGRVGPYARALSARTAADDTGAMAVSWIKLAGLLSYYAWLHAL